MKAVASPPISKLAPGKRSGRAIVHSAADAPWFLTPSSARDSIVVQRKAACVCGGGCPRCEHSSDRSQTPAASAIDTPGDQFEVEADRIAERVMRMPDAFPLADPHPTAKQLPADAGQMDVPPHVHATLRSSGQPLDSPTRRFFEPRFQHDFDDVRVHADSSAAAAAATIGASAFTSGRSIVFGAGQFRPGTRSGNELIAHELAHVVQQQTQSPSRARIQRRPATDPAALQVADDIDVAVYSLPTNASTEHRYSRKYHIGAAGAMVIDDGQNTVKIDLAGLTLLDAAQRIADRLVEAQIFRGPRVCVTDPRSSVKACANAKSAMRRDVAAAYANFLDYIRTTKEPAVAVARYYQWISDHRDSAEFTELSPSDLWTQSLRPPARPPDPEAERTEHWIRFMKERQAENEKLPQAEQARATETMLRFRDWYDKHHDDRDFAKADPARVYADISVAQIKQSVEASVRQKIEAGKQEAVLSPESITARSAKLDEFVALGLKLWGYSARTYPYSIPLDSQGKDILVTGDPALQRVLNALAGALVHWATTHSTDANYLAVSPKSVLLELLQSGYSEKIADAQLEPLEHETIDRNELLPSGVFAAFGETIATGLLGIAIVGLFVGAEIITAGQATWIIAGYAGYSGVKSYAARRDEIERSGYNVSVPETMLDSAGDMIGVSQLIEGIWGKRLGTDEPMGSEGRSTQLGAGGGTVATLVFGSRAYLAGEGVGQTARLSRPGLTPSGPNANVPIRPIPPKPAVPASNPAMGPVESTARAALPENLRPGLDLWSTDIRKAGASPEKVFGKMKPEKIQSQAEAFLKRYDASVADSDLAAHQAARATDDPLRPRLRNVVSLEGSKVTMHYENTPPSTREIAQAVELSKRTGEVVHLFGDTASGVSYPGIDGTIGNPARALSLKNAVARAHPNLARKMAGDALESAKSAGYTHVEVRIDMPGSTVAEIRSAWDAAPPLPSDPLPGPAFEGSVVAKIIVRGSDGEWTLTPPPKGPPLTGVTPIPARPDRKDKQ